jgi:predicted nucleotidyltransferase component of viral defense system
MDKEMLLMIGRKKGLKTKDHIEKDYFQDLLLFHIYQNTNLLAFKGGTALYKLYQMPRFSEDLDFTLLGPFDIEKTIEGIAKGLKATVKAKKLKDSILFRLRFKGILTLSNTIRLDISLKNKALLGFDVKNYIPEYIDINPFSLRAIKLEEMVAEKIHSLLVRKKARDLYDLFFLLRISRFDKKLVNEKLKIFNMKFSFESIKRKINELESVWEPELRPFLLADLPKFSVVKEFVIRKMKC